MTATSLINTGITLSVTINTNLLQCFFFQVLTMFWAKMRLLLQYDRLPEQRITREEWQMEQGDWCALRWMNSECVLAVPGLLCFHSAALRDGKWPEGLRHRRGRAPLHERSVSCMEKHRNNDDVHVHALRNVVVIRERMLFNDWDLVLFSQDYSIDYGLPDCNIKNDPFLLVQLISRNDKIR